MAGLVATKHNFWLNLTYLLSLTSFQTAKHVWMSPCWPPDTVQPFLSLVFRPQDTHLGLCVSDTLQTMSGYCCSLRRVPCICSNHTFSESDVPAAMWFLHKGLPQNNSMPLIAHALLRDVTSGSQISWWSRWSPDSVRLSVAFDVPR